MATRRISTPFRVPESRPRRVLQIYGVDSLINSNVGPKAFSKLKAGDIKVYVGATGSVKNATEQFISRKFECLRKSNVEGHWM